MQVAVHSLSLFASLIVLVVGAFGRTWLSRRFLRPRRLQALVIGVGAALSLVNTVPYFVSSPAAQLVAFFVTAALGAAVVVWAYNQRITTTTAPNPRRIVAIGAHPDDLELACGGTLAKLADSGHEVHAVVMSDGRVGGDSAVRRTEARMGGAFLGSASVDLFSFTDTAMAAEGQQMVQAIESVLLRYNPDIILTHSGHDQHQDHNAVHLATLRAARRHPSILCYESPSATRDFDPSVFVEISDYVDVKVRAVEMHRDQSGKPYMTPDRVRGTAAFRGSQAKRPYAEGYEPVRMLDWTIGT